MKPSKLIVKLKCKNKCSGIARSVWEKENYKEGNRCYRLTQRRTNEDCDDGELLTPPACPRGPGVDDAGKTNSPGGAKQNWVSISYQEWKQPHR